MAEIETSRSGKKKSFNKKSTRVDLTPMVDLGFLLLTFFVFTTALTKPMVTDLNMPYDKAPPGDKICESCALTVLLDKNNRIKYYEGDAKNNPQIHEAGFANGEIRSVLMQKKAAVIKLRKNDQFILIIKASDSSNFKNFVDITDEATICGIKRYYVDEMKEVDKQMMVKK